MIGPIFDNLFDVWTRGSGPMAASEAVPPGRVNPVLVEQVRVTCQAIQSLYHQAAEEGIKEGAASAKMSADQLMERMDDLHRGLIIRIYLEMTAVDWSWRPGEAAVSQAVFEHLWGKTFSERGLLKAHEQLARQEPPDWQALINPFLRLPPLMQHRDELLTHAMRLANLVIKADGRIAPQEKQQLHILRAHLENLLKPLPLAEEKQPLQAGQQVLLTQEAGTTATTPPPVAKPVATPAIVLPPGDAAKQFAEAMAELNGFIGLDSIKSEVKRLVNFLKMQKERINLGLPETKVSLHSVFQGNPGTGKTTVARLLGRLLGAIGFLAKGHLVETDRSGLVAEYAGQTGPKANKKIDEALDGVLFIDEAYSLIAEKGDDPYGAEAVQTLLKRMEDHRDRLVVVLAGYPAPLQRLLKSNPGLSSRFNRYFNFPDYAPLELCQIWETFSRRCQYVLSGATRAKLILGLHYLCQQKDEHFGNGRLIRNLYEKSITRLADRIVDIAPLTKEVLTRLEPEDLAFDDVPAEVWQALGKGETRFVVDCTGCQHSSRIRPDYLGQRLQCRRCQSVFSADWGEPG